MAYRVYPPEIDPKVVEQFKLAPRLAERAVIREFDSGVTAGLMSLNDFSKRLALRCVEADPIAGLAFSLPEGTEIPREIKESKHLWIVITSDQYKMQFIAPNVKFGGFDLITCDFPTEVVSIQRRESFRVPAPNDRTLDLVISGSFSAAVEPRIFDIGYEGIGLEFNAMERMQVGTIWSSCHFARGKKSSESFMLQVMNVSDVYNLDHFRVGCKVLKPSPQTKTDFETTRDSIQNCIVSGQPQRWHLSVSWLSS